MQKYIISVLLSFSGVIFTIMAGINIAYRTNVIPKIERDFQEENQTLEQTITNFDDTIAKLNGEIEIARQQQQFAEARLKEKLAEEERIALEKAQALERARIAANIKAAKDAEAAKTARLAAAKKATSKSTKKSKAS